MKLFLIAARNLKRSWFRTIFTIVGAAVALVAFVMIRTVLWAWSLNAESGAQDRLATRHRVTMMVQLPQRYVAEMRGVPGVKEVTWVSWFGGRDPKRPNEFFANLAVDPKTFLVVNDDIIVSEEDKRRWFEDRSGALIGASLAKTMGWKVGDRVVLEGTFYPGNHDFNIDGIYTTTGPTNDDGTFYFHWDYVNGIAPEGAKDTVGWMVSKITDDKRSAEISTAIDRLFEDRDNQTSTMSERAMTAGFLAGAVAILQALDVVSFIILLIMLLILGNTIAMGVRERTREYAVMRCIGFEPGHVRFFVIGEAVALGFAAGMLGLALAYPLVNNLVGPALVAQVGSSFPKLRVQPVTAIAAGGGAILLAVGASLFPAIQAARITVTEALRRV